MHPLLRRDRLDPARQGRRLCSKLSPWKRGMLALPVVLGRSSAALWIRPVRRPRPSGRVGDERRSRARDTSRSASSAGCRVEERVLELHRADRVQRTCARRMVAGARPRRDRGSAPSPAPPARLIAPTVSSIGRLGVDPVLVVEVDHVRRRGRCEARVARPATTYSGRAVHPGYRRRLGRAPGRTSSRGRRVARGPVSARPISSSLCPHPYMSAESRRLRRGRARDGSRQSTARRRSCRTSPTWTCSRAPGGGP